MTRVAGLPGGEATPARTAKAAGGRKVSDRAEGPPRGSVLPGAGPDATAVTVALPRFRRPPGKPAMRGTSVAGPLADELARRVQAWAVAAESRVACYRPPAFPPSLRVPGLPLPVTGQPARRSPPQDQTPNLRRTVWKLPRPYERSKSAQPPPGEPAGTSIRAPHSCEPGRPLPESALPCRGPLVPFALRHCAPGSPTYRRRNSAAASRPCRLRSSWNGSTAR